MDESSGKNAIAAADGSAWLTVPHGRLALPTFLPDATRGVVRAVDAQDLRQCGIQALQMNVFHLMQKPGSLTIKALGGLHRMSGWAGPIVTDSGGFQVYSLIRQNPKWGQITSKGMLVRREDAHNLNLTPQKSIQLQIAYGADVCVCLDDCTDVQESTAAQEEAVKRTIAWARLCKLEFQRQVAQRGLAPEARPLLFAVVQGGGERELRKRCAEELLEIGFDGFGLGGWPLDAEGHLLTDIIAYIRELIPSCWPMHALGVGQPANVVTCARMGYRLFDSIMPTRDARRGRLYVMLHDPASSSLQGQWSDYLYIADAKHVRTAAPVSAFCDCPACTHYSLAYLHHLFRIQDPLYARLATMHNLRFMAQLMSRLRQLALASASGSTGAL